MAYSLGIPYFCGYRIAHNAEITSMTANVQPIVKVFPRTIGGVLKGGGAVSKSITLTCRVIPPDGTSRAALEQFMHTFNETYGPLQGILLMDDNEFTDCSIAKITYEPKIVNNYLVFNIDFEMGVQKADEESPTPLVPRQLIPSRLYADTRGRPAQFSKIYGEGLDEVTRTFNFWHNVDIVRNLENRLTIELSDKYSKDNVIKFNGGFEMITAYCWMKAAQEYQEEGWRQTVSAYIYNIMNGPLGDIGTLYLGGNVITPCIFTDVKLMEVFPTSARYELMFMVSLQC